MSFPVECCRRIGSAECARSGGSSSPHSVSGRDIATDGMMGSTRNFEDFLGLNYQGDLSVANAQISLLLMMLMCPSFLSWFKHV
jgi:hypothetical protein